MFYEIVKQNFLNFFYLYSEYFFSNPKIIIYKKQHFWNKIIHSRNKIVLIFYFFSSKTSHL